MRFAFFSFVLFNSICCKLLFSFFVFSNLSFLYFAFSLLNSQQCEVRPCVPLTQLVELNFRELFNSTLTKVVIGYITRELYITSFVKNNDFLAIIISFLTKIATFDKNW